MVRGRCLCGHVVYEYDGVVGPASYCHCEDWGCQIKSNQSN